MSVRENRVLQSLTGLLWDTVARIADGVEPDDEDRSVISNAQYALHGQVEMLNFVQSRAASAAPTAAVRGTDAFMDMIWMASDQLEARDLVPVRDSTGIEDLIAVLARIAERDAELAEKYEPLFGRVAALAENFAVEPSSTF